MMELVNCDNITIIKFAIFIKIVCHVILFNFEKSILSNSLILLISFYAAKMVSKEVEIETKDMEGYPVSMTSLFSKEKYVKVKKGDGNKILDAFNKAISRNYLLEKYEKKISALEKN